VNNFPNSGRADFARSWTSRPTHGNEPGHAATRMEQQLTSRPAGIAPVRGKNFDRMKLRPWSPLGAEESQQFMLNGLRPIGASGTDFAYVVIAIRSLSRA
jgi:hypothetical protein